jgi:hypothetical protein
VSSAGIVSVVSFTSTLGRHDDVSAPRQQPTETLQKVYDGKLRLERRNGGSKI